MQQRVKTSPLVEFARVKVKGNSNFAFGSLPVAVTEIVLSTQKNVMNPEEKMINPEKEMI